MCVFFIYFELLIIKFVILLEGLNYLLPCQSLVFITRPLFLFGDKKTTPLRIRVDKSLRR